MTHASVRLAAEAVAALFAEDGWPRIEVLVDAEDRRTVPLSDDDADKVRALRKALAEVGEPVADEATEQMRAETGHDCIACPTRVRDLSATAHNLLTRLDGSRTSEGMVIASELAPVFRKGEELRESLAKIQPILDAHFEALHYWRRPSPRPAPRPEGTP